MAEFCADAGMVNAVNLDGGGSAQMLLENKRSLMISDRNGADGGEAERPVPLALIIE
jgi:exopolysaccharide biosynthesis protein